MSVSVRTATMSIHPQVYEGKNGKVFSADVMEPKNYRFVFSAEGGTPIPQMQALLERCYETGQEVDITFSQKTDNWGKQSFVIYGVNPKRQQKAG